MDGLMSTLGIDANADYLFEVFTMVTNKSTKRYLEAALVTPTWYDRSITNCQSAKDFHQHNRFIPTSYILMDNQSTVDVFYNPNLLWNTCTSNCTIYLS